MHKSLIKIFLAAIGTIISISLIFMSMTEVTVAGNCNYEEWEYATPGCGGGFDTSNYDVFTADAAACAAICAGGCVAQKRNRNCIYTY